MQLFQSRSSEHILTLFLIHLVDKSAPSSPISGRGSDTLMNSSQVGKARDMESRASNPFTQEMRDAEGDSKMNIDKVSSLCSFLLTKSCDLFWPTLILRFSPYFPKKEIVCLRVCSKKVAPSKYPAL